VTVAVAVLTEVAVVVTVVVTVVVVVWVTVWAVEAVVAVVVVVVVVVGEYVNVADPVAGDELPDVPYVTVTVKVPAIQFELPPAVKFRE
jgi:hypothetical protein